MKTPQTLEKHSPSFPQLLAIVILLILPTLAAMKLAHVLDYRLILIYVTTIFAISYLTCASDKKKAQKKAWRIPESSLHFLELAGGWPGSFLAQRRFRHKISKTGYQVVFWMIVILHQYVALDYLNDWKVSSIAVSSILQ